VKGCAHITPPFSAIDVLSCVHDIAVRIIAADFTNISVSSVALLVEFYTRGTIDFILR
jgi:hypothetical protein